MDNLRRTLPPLDPLVAFEAAARLASFTAAARELNLTQAAISRQIRLLEANLGQRLFVRAHRRVALTAEGRDLQHTVALALRHLAHAAQDLRRERPGARITIGADAAIAALWLLPRLGDLRATFPDRVVRLIASDEDAVCLGAGIDIALLHGDGMWPGRRVDRLFAEEIFPVCAPAYRDRVLASGDLRGLADATLIDLEDEHRDWVNWRVWLTERGMADLPTARRLRFNSYPLVVEAAADGLGVALGWRHLVDAALAQGRLVRPMAASLTTRFAYWLVTAPALSEDAAAVAAWLLTQCAP